MKSWPTAERVRSLLSYDPLSGVFHWKVSQGNAVAGRIAGSPERKGYMRINVDGVRQKAHCLAWLYVIGSWPDRQIDHRNGDPSDNRFKNLRLATNAQNCANAKAPRNNTSGIKGVSRTPNGRWIAGIKVDYRRRHLGTFDTPEAAALAYAEAAHAAFGDFANPDRKETP